MSRRRAADASAVLAGLAGPCRHAVRGGSIADSSIVGRSIVGRSIVGRSIVGRSIVGRSIVGRSIVGRSIVGRSPQRRRYASQGDARRIAIVGGGLTGLTAAYYLAQRVPASTRITLYEASNRLGGWIMTDKVPVAMEGLRGTVSLERGPRTLSSLHTTMTRFDDLVLYDLALDLGLSIATPPDQPRYIFYPDHLVAMPPDATLAQMFGEPLFYQLLRPALSLLVQRVRGGRLPPAEDLSIAEWLHYISGSRVMGDNLASAMIHGIYGGDIDRLSARSVLGSLYWAFYAPWPKLGKRHMPVREQLLMTALSQDPLIRKLALRPKGSLLHFGPAGMESLTAALANALEAQPNIDIRKESPVHGIRYNAETRKVEVTTGGPAQQQQQQQQQQQPPSPEAYDRVIATTSSHDLARATGGKLPTLAQTHSVSIMTVNIWYPHQNLKPPGFGYLIPRSVPRELNPERALGVFFDSDVLATAPDEPPGTKLFVLLGGHYYDADGGRPPTLEVAIAQAQTLLERQLGIPRNTSCLVLARLARDCIPQHTVGHHHRMMRLDQELRDAFAGRLAVAGGSYSRIGAMAALRAGFDIASLTTCAGDEGWLSTGLEHLELPPQYVSIPTSCIPVRDFGEAE